MAKIILIGCGYIGAYCDWNTAFVSSHAKAFSSHVVDLYVYDIDPIRAYDVSRKYKCTYVADLSLIRRETFDIAVIATPTSTHSDYIDFCLSSRVNIIVTEKPLASNLAELSTLYEKYQLSNKRIFVNYHRRFLKPFSFVKDYINLNCNSDQKPLVHVDYQRGILNNGTHAIDLLNYFFGSRFDPRNLSIHSAAYDHFPNDPTVSLSCETEDYFLEMRGLQDIKYSVFQIQIFFQSVCICLKDGCNSIQISRRDDTVQPPYPLPRLIYDQHSCMINSMKDVAAHFLEALTDLSIEDNFEDSVELARSIFNVTSSINL